MNIVNICMGAPFTEGYTYQDSMLSDYQHRLGHEVTVITGLRTRDKNGKIVQTTPTDSILSNGVHLIRLAPKGFGKIANNIMGIFSDIPVLLEKLAPDLIMVHGLGSHAASYAVDYHKRHTQTVLIADSHQDYGITNTSNPVLNTITRYYKYRWKKWISSFDKIYAVTSWRTLFAHEQYGIPYEKMDILVLGIGDEYINLCNNNTNRKSIRETYNIPQDAFVFCSGGKLDANKQIIPMMRAFSQVKEEHLRYLIFGSVAPHIADDFQSILQSDNRIIHIGYIPSAQTNCVLAASDFGLFAGNHSVLWEQAVGCGLPCLFKKYGEHDHVDIGGNCFQLQNADVDSIQKIIEKVVLDTGFYRKMKDIAQAGAETFSYSAIAKKSLECTGQSK